MGDLARWFRWPPNVFDDMDLYDLELWYQQMQRQIKEWNERVSAPQD